MTKKRGAKGKGRSRRKSDASRRGQQNAKKGRLLEEIAARMLKSPRINVERNARLSPLKGKIKRTRDIDLLLSGKVVSRPSKHAVECKNLGKKAGIGKIGEFVDKLSDVGIPHDHGIFISAYGYTRDAIDRAGVEGLKLLTLTGLTEDRLQPIRSEAFQFCVFYLAQVTGVTVTNEIDTIENSSDLLVFFDETNNFCGTVADLIWNRWREGEPSCEAGERNLTVAVPDNWHQVVNGKRTPVLSLNATIKVWALALQFTGQATDHSLINVQNGSLEKRQVNASFDIPMVPSVVHQLKAFDSETDLNSWINERGKLRLTTRTALPRIDWLGKFFYPLSEHVLQLLKQHSEDYDTGKTSSIPELIVAETEGTDLNAMWEPLTEGYPGKQLPVVIVPDNTNGSSLDLTGLLRLGDFKRVIEFEKYLGDHPRLELAEVIHAAYLHYGLSLMEQACNKKGPAFLKLVNRAIRQVRKALRLNPNSPDAYHDLGLAFREMRRHKEAVRNFNIALKLDPNRYQTLALRAKSLTDLGSYDEALKDWESVLTNNPKDIEAIYFRSGLLGALNRYEESIASYDQLIKVVPEHGETWRARGLGLLNLERLEEALTSFEKAFRFGDKSAELHSCKGRALQSLGRHREALEEYDQTLSIAPDMFETLLNRGSMLSALGRHEEAVDSFDRGLRHVKGTDLIWNTRACSLQSLGRMDEALESYERALVENPKNRMVFTNRGLLLAELGRLEEALDSFNTALELEPQNLATLHSRGLVFYRLGRDEEALADYDHLLELNREAFDSWSNKGLILAELGRYEEAVAAADESIGLADEHADLKMLRLIRAKVLFLAKHHTLAAEEMVSAWRMDAERIVSLRESREMFIEIYGVLPKPSEEQTLMFAEVSWNEAAAAMDDDEPDKAALHAKNATLAYNRVAGLVTSNNFLGKSSVKNQTPNLSAAANDVLDRTAIRLAVYREQEFAQPMFCLVGIRNDAPRA